MIVERKTPKNTGALWTWLTYRMPPSWSAMKVPSGYGYALCIYQSGNTPGFWARSFEQKGDPILQVFGDTAELYHPQYFSDVEGLLQRFEKETGIVPTLRYWEGPNKHAEVVNA